MIFKGCINIFYIYGFVFLDSATLFYCIFRRVF